MSGDLSSSLNDPALYPNWMWILGTVLVVAVLGWIVYSIWRWWTSRIGEVMELQTITDARRKKYLTYVDQIADRYVKHDKSASRDIVLCLDSSGSMLPYDSKIGGAFRQIISHFEGERISLQLWDAYSMTMFPLTDDYDMATDVLQDMSDTIDTGLIQVGGKISGTRELFEYLEPVLDEKQEVSSLVGDGLASCIMGFDHNDKQRSRTILLATDNEVYGSGVYDLSEAIEFAKSQGVTVTALYPGSDISLSSEALQLRDEVRKTGGDFYDASSPSAVDSVVRQIEAEQKEELDSAGKMIETDRPGAALGWTLVGVVSLLGLLAFGRL